MKRQRFHGVIAALAVTTVLGVSDRGVQASDHDDGETDLKSRALNLTDHYAFKSGTNLSLVMYVNPRSLPGRQYAMSTNARYEFHVSKVADKLAAAPEIASGLNAQHLWIRPFETGGGGIEQFLGSMHVPTALAVLQRLQALQYFCFKRCAKPTHRFQAARPCGFLERFERVNSQLFVEFENFFGSHSRQPQQLQHPRRRFAAHLLQDRMRAGIVHLLNDIGDGAPNAGDFGQAVGLDDAVQR